MPLVPMEVWWTWMHLDVSIEESFDWLNFRELWSCSSSLMWFWWGRIQVLSRNQADIVKVQVHKMSGKDMLQVTHKGEPRNLLVNYHQFISICSHPLPPVYLETIIHGNKLQESFWGVFTFFSIKRLSEYSQTRNTTG